MLISRFLPTLILTWALGLWMTNSQLLADDQPILQLDAGGPTSLITSLQFSPDGQTLYAGSWDKVVHVWKTHLTTGQWERDRAATLRLPIGPGMIGAINAMSLSPDGNWLAVAGRGVVSGESGFRDLGMIVPTSSLSDEQLQDLGLIYVMHLHSDELHLLRAHRGEVVALTFVPTASGGPQLVSAGRDLRNEQGQIHLWDVQAEKVLQSAPSLPNLSSVRPRLSAWVRQGQRRVGIAWGDETMRVWNVDGQTGLFPSPANGRYANTMAHWVDDFVITGSYTREGGVLRRWYQLPGGPLQLDNRWQHVYRPVNGVTWLPRDLVLLPSAGNGNANANANAKNLAATIVSRIADGGVQGHELQLVRLDRDEVAARAALTPQVAPRDRAAAPVLVASPDGATLAVSVEGSPEILIFRTRELLEGKTEPVQRLQSLGNSVRSAVLVRHADGRGIALGGSSVPRFGELPQVTQGQPLLDLNQSRITSHVPETWQLDLASASAWNVRAESRSTTAGKPNSYAVNVAPTQPSTRSPELARSRTIALPPERPPTQAIVWDDAKRPLAAIATSMAGESIITLYDVATGSALRELRGHVQPIRSLAFSQDGQLLVSAGDDPVVCLWNLRDLAESRTRHGQCRGVRLVEYERQGKVEAVTDDQPSNFPLQPGDILEGYWQNEQLVPWTAVMDFHRYFWTQTPGQMVRVQIRRANERRTVDVPVEQATDERKPLAYLFPYAENRAGEEFGPPTHWIAWSPLGPFDASGRDAESLLGWHFNRASAGLPTTYSPVNEYRQEFYHQGLLSQLVERGSLPDRPAVPLDRPTINLILPNEGEPIGTPQSEAERIVRRAPAQAIVKIWPLPSHQIQQVELQFEDDTKVACAVQADGRWIADLSSRKWKRGVEVLRAVVQTRELVPQQFTEQIAVRYLLPTPHVVWAAMPAEVDADTPVTLAASIRPADGDSTTPVGYRVTVNGHSVEEATEGQQAAVDVRCRLPLQAGRNRVELTAYPAYPADRAETAAAPAPEETFHEVRWIEQKTSEPTSRLVIKRLSVHDRSNGWLEANLTNSGPLVVSSDQVRIEFEYEGPAPTLVSRRLGDQTTPLTMDYRAGMPVVFSDTLTVSPGLQSVEVEVQAEGRTPVRERVEIVYRPEPLEIAIEEPADGQLMIEGQDAPSVHFVARWEPTTDGPVTEAKIRVNGREVKGPVTLNGSDGQWETDLELEQGENQIELVTTTPGHSESTQSAVTVLYRRPPVMELVEPKVAEEAPFVDLRATIRSSSPIARIEVDGRDVPLDTLQPMGEDRWAVNVDQVPLVSGRNTIAVRAWNRDGSAILPAVAHVDFDLPTLPIPKLELVQPILDEQVTEEWQSIECVVQTASPLRRTEVRLNGQPLPSVPDWQVSSAEGSKEWVGRLTMPIKLNPGVNLLEVRTVNDGGEDRQARVITYVEPPVRIVIDRFEGERKEGERVTSIQNPPLVRGTRVFSEAVPVGHAQIRGRVIYAKPNDPRLLRSESLRIWVNGFLQEAVDLKPVGDDGKSRAFAAPLVLGRAEENRIELQLPGLQEMDGSSLNCVVDCKEPVRTQNLHLLIVGVGSDAKADQLRRQAMQALRAEEGKPDGDQIRFTTEAFASGVMYGPLVGSRVTPHTINYWLDQMEESIRARHARSAQQDVVMIYYSGGELLEDTGRFLLTTARLNNPQLRRPKNVALNALASDRLTDFVMRTPGAHLLLLDVARSTNASTQSVKAQLPAEARTAVLRFAWLNQDDAPPQAKLITALPTAIELASGAGEAMEVDLEGLASHLAREFIADQVRYISRRYPESLTFEAFIPDPLMRLIVVR